MSFCTEITASLPVALSGQQILKRCGTIDLGLTSEDRPTFDELHLGRRISFMVGINPTQHPSPELLSSCQTDGQTCDNM